MVGEIEPLCFRLGSSSAFCSSFISISIVFTREHTIGYFRTFDLLAHELVVCV